MSTSRTNHQSSKGLPLSTRMRTSNAKAQKSSHSSQTPQPNYSTNQSMIKSPKGRSNTLTSNKNRNIRSSKTPTHTDGKSFVWGGQSSNSHYPVLSTRGIKGKMSSKSSKSTRHIIKGSNDKQVEFKIGMGVGLALGECHLHVTKLETTVEQLTTVSEDIQDVIQYLREQMGGQIPPRKREDGKDEAGDPFVEVLILNDNLNTWKADAGKRMKNLTKSISSLQVKLEELDDFAKNVRSSTAVDRSELEGAHKTIAELRGDLHIQKRQNNETNYELSKLKRTLTDRKKELDDRAKKLEEREKALDHDAEIIATQSDELRKESERLLKERDEVRKQKEQWQQMLEEQKEHKLKLEQRELEVRKDYRQLRQLEERIETDKEKIAKKKKKIKAREKRYNALRESNKPHQNDGGFGGMSMNGGSEYAESELTYFSDGDTEIASVNSISDDESEHQSQKGGQKGNNMAHLNIPHQYN